MAQVSLHLPRMLHQFTGGESNLAIEAESVRAALEVAMERHPMLRRHLMTEAGVIREHLHVFLNDDDVRNQLDHALSDRDEIHVLQAMSGG